MNVGISEIREDPELAALRALEGALLAAEDALLAGWPELTTGEEPRKLPHRAILADQLGVKAASLRRALNRYAEATKRARRLPSQPLPDDGFAT